MATETLEKTITLEIRDLHAAVEGKEILKGIDLTVRQGEVHALMGPNGSGKSTLANVLMGRPSYTVTAGEILFAGEDITSLTADKRAQLGPVPGVPVPDRDPRRVGRELPALGVQRRARRGDVGARVQQAAAGEDGAARRGGRDGRAGT